MKKEEIENRFELKNVKTGFGHDMNGLHATLYFDKKPIVEYDDDGWGGGATFDIQNQALCDKAIAFLWENKYAERLYESGYDFITAQEIHNSKDILIEEVIVGLCNRKQQEKYTKKMNEMMKSAILIGSDMYSFRYYKYKKPLALLDRVQLQDFIDNKVKPKLSKGEKILNTNLEELGIKI